MNKQVFKYPHEFKLESGKKLQELEMGFHTYGKLNKEKDNVGWVCHAVTANSDVFDWWKGLFGEKNYFNPDEHFIICANILGSHYGTTSPLSENPVTGRRPGKAAPPPTPPWRQSRRRQWAIGSGCRTRWTGPGRR